MTIQYINTGSSANSGNGDSLRSAFNKVNSNFEYLSTASFSGSSGNGYTGSQGSIGYTGSAAIITGFPNFLPIYSQSGTSLQSSSSISIDTTNSGTLVVGTNPVLGSSVDGNLVLIRNSHTNDPLTGFNFLQFHEVQDSSNFGFFRARGTSTASNVAINGDDIIDINFDSVSVVGIPSTGAQINVAVEGTPGSRVPMRMSFSTDAGAGLLKRVEISSTGTVKLDRIAGLTSGTIVSNSHIIPSQDLTYDLGSTSSQWRSLYVGTSTVYFGGIPLRVTSEGGITVNDVPVAGTGTVQPHLELTDTPFITQPVTLGTDTTITASVRGIDALVDVVIGEGSVIDSITVTTPGLLYVVGQRYRLNYWQVGGNDDADNIDFEVATVGSTGTLLTVANAAFVGTATNTPGTYSNISIEYRPTEFDEVDTGLTLTRGIYGGLFNSETEFSYNSSESPIGTLWNADGWDTLVGFNTRTYDTFDSILTGPDSTPPPELVMWDTINDKYYKFAINVWGVDNNEYSYTRTLITDPNYFKKTDGLQDGEIDNIKEQPLETIELEVTYLEAEAMWVDARDADAANIAPDTRPWDGMSSIDAYPVLIDAGVQSPPAPSNFPPLLTSANQAYLTWQEARAEAIGITRGMEQGIYNPYRESGWNSNTSPAGTLWNIDGWTDLTDIESRTYTNFYAAYGNGQLGNRVPGSKAVMYVPELDKYYAIEWLAWTQGGDYGGFSYTRRELDLTKLTQGITFADGTVQTTAYLGTNVVSTAPGLRRIETASGYNQVSVTQRVTDNYTGAVSQTTNGYELRVARTPELDAVIIPLNENNTNETYTLSFDNITFREVWLSSIQQNEYWFYYQNDFGQTTPQTEGDTVYITVTTGADPVVWWDKNNLPGGSQYFRGAVIDYHAYTGESTIIGSIHIVDDDGEEHISHQEVQSGDIDGENDDLWYVTSEGQIRYRRIDGESKTLKIHWTAKVFYGSELYD